MILVEIRVDRGESIALVHPGLTHVQGLDSGTRRAWADALTRALRGESDPTAPIDIEVEVDGKRQPLTPALGRSLAVGDAARSVIVFAADLPGAKARATPVATDDLAALEAEVAAADSRAARLRNECAAADRSAIEAVDAFMAASHRVDKNAESILAEAEHRHAAATATLSAARKALAEADETARTQADLARRIREALNALQTERTRLETDRSGLVARMVEIGDPGDPAPVESALAALRRLRQVKLKPSSQGSAIADRWTASLTRLAALPQPPAPPEWLVLPALAALQEAKVAVTAAKASAVPRKFDPSKIEALDRAHREVLEAEQRSMRKGSRVHRRRLDGANAAEQAALSELGVKSYGEYLQRTARGADSGSGPDGLAVAEAALADAEAVWEELHGGQATSEWTAAKEEQASVRQEAHDLLGRAVDDTQLEAELRAHLEAVVETGWAERELAAALQHGGAHVTDGDDLEEVAEHWLAESPAAREQRAVLNEQLEDLDTRLATVETELAESQSEVFVGQDSADGEPKSDDASGPADAVSAADAADAAAADAAAADATAVEAAASAEREFREAESAVAAARERLSASDHEQGRLAGLEADADARRREVDELAVQLQEAESAVDQERSKIGSPAVSPAVSSGVDVNEGTPTEHGVDLSAVVGMEAEAYLLARVAALRGAQGGPLPLVVDVDATTGLSEQANRRVLRLLGRLANSMQVVVLGDDEKVATWAEGLGDQAAVRAVAR